MDEGVAQLFTSSLNGRKIIGTVGALQFEVIQYRLEHEYNAACRWEPISIYKACWIDSDNAAQLADFKRRKHTNMAVDKHGRDVFLADTSYGLARAGELQGYPLPLHLGVLGRRLTLKTAGAFDSGGFSHQAAAHQIIGTSMTSSRAFSEARIRKSSASDMPMPSRGPSGSPATSAVPSITKT